MANGSKSFNPFVKLFANGFRFVLLATKSGYSKGSYFYYISLNILLFFAKYYFPNRVLALKRRKLIFKINQTSSHFKKLKNKFLNVN